MWPKRTKIFCTNCKKLIDYNTGWNCPYCGHLETWTWIIYPRTAPPGTPCKKCNKAAGLLECPHCKHKVILNPNNDDMVITIEPPITESFLKLAEKVIEIKERLEEQKEKTPIEDRALLAAKKAAFQKALNEGKLEEAPNVILDILRTERQIYEERDKIKRIQKPEPEKDPHEEEIKRLNEKLKVWIARDHFVVKKQWERKRSLQRFQDDEIQRILQESNYDQLGPEEKKRVDREIEDLQDLVQHYMDAL
jgi:DNA-directed RNA polymerase subunit RPC12/RpoP